MREQGRGKRVSMSMGQIIVYLFVYLRAVLGDSWVACRRACVGEITLVLLWGHFEVTLGHFGPLWRHFGVTLGSLLACEGGFGSL